MGQELPPIRFTGNGNVLKMFIGIEQEFSLNELEAQDICMYTGFSKVVNPGLHLGSDRSYSVYLVLYELIP